MPAEHSDEFSKQGGQGQAPILRITGEVERELALSYADLCALPADAQVQDVRRLGAKRDGDAARLTAILQLAGVRAGAAYLTLHSSADDFHASIPLDAVRDAAILIYRQSGNPLPASSGGPVRFFIPNYAECHAAEVDECSNVKFVDHIELSRSRGLDNRPADEQEHAELHEREGSG